jgi:hypothetical protein
LSSYKSTAPRKRGAAAFDPADCTTWGRTKLNLHQRWEAGNLPFEEHINVDLKQHATWQRFMRAGGLKEGIEEVAPKASGGNRKREAAAVSAEASVSEMMCNPSQHYVLLNSKLLLAAEAFKADVAANPKESVRTIAKNLEQKHEFGWRTIQKNGTKIINDSSYVPDIRGGRQTLAHNPQSDAFFDHIEQQIALRNPQGQDSVIDVPKFVSECWLSFYAKNSGAVAPVIPKKTMDVIEARVKTFAEPQSATKKAEHTSEQINDPRNTMSWGAVTTACLAGRPAELKGNWDDTSFMVGEEMAIKAIGYTHKQIAEQMKALGRNYSFHWTGTGQMQCRMFVTGFLTLSSGKLPLCVVKFFDRQLPLQKTRIAKYYLGRLYNGCHLWWLFVRLPPQGEGSNNDEEVNRVVFRDLVLPVIEAEKLDYARETIRLEAVQAQRASAAVAPRNPSQANMSSNSRASISSVASSASRSHSGLRSTDLPPGTFTAEELFIRPGDNPAINSEGRPFAQRQREEERDSDDDRGSEDEAEDKRINDEDVGLLPLNIVSSAEDESGVMPPPVAWVPSILPSDEVRPLSSIQRQLQDFLQQHGLDAFNLRFALTLDGACPQMGSLMGMPGHSTNPDGVIHEYFAPAGNDVVKGPSSCTMFSNANDVSRCHHQLKDFVKRYMSRKPHYTSRMMKDFLTSVVPTLGLDAATVRTINYFCGHLEDMICKVWVPSNIKSGWAKAGLLADTESGLNIDVLLGHWIGMHALPQASYDVIRSAIPALAEEAIATTSVSDASMARFQRYFPVSFKYSRTDRALMSWPRMRAAILVADKSKHLRNKNVVNAVGDISGNDDGDDPPISHGYVQQKGKDGASVCMRICWCKAAAFKNARLYANTAAGWKAHKKSAPHVKWRASQRQPAAARVAADQSVDGVEEERRQLFADHPYAENCGEFLNTLADELSLSFEVAERFRMHGIIDSDYVMFATMRPALYYSIFGITHANAVLFADICLDEYDERINGVQEEEDQGIQEEEEEVDEHGNEVPRHYNIHFEE